MQKDQKKESSAPAKAKKRSKNHAQSHLTHEQNSTILQPLNKQYHYISCGIVFISTLIVYILTAPRSVTFEDSGLFILAAKYWGVSHPPGYPLYTFLGHLFSMLPFSSLGFRISLLSVILGSLSAVLCYILFVYESRHYLLSILASLVLFTSATVWSQMIVAEVYPLHLFFVCLITCLLFIKNQSQVTEFRPYAVITFGLIVGLSLSNHWPLIILCSPAFLFLCSKKWLTTKNIILFFVSLMVGLTPYIVMCFRSQTDLEISFLGPINSVKELIQYVLRSYYADGDKSVLYSAKDAIRFINSFFASILYKDFFPGLLLLAILGFRYLWITKRRQIILTIVFMLLSSTVILQLFLKLEFNILNENIQRVFWLTPFFAFVWISFYGGLYLESKKKWTGVVTLFFAFVFQVVFYYSQNDFSSDQFAEDYGRIILSGVPDDSILFASTDGDVGPIAYVHLGLNENPTIKMYTGTSVFLKNRVHHPSLSNRDLKQKLFADFIDSVERVYSVKNLAVFSGDKSTRVGFTFNGLLYEYSTRSVRPTSISPVTLAMTEKALDNYIEHININNWNYHRDTLASRLCNLLVLNNREDHPVFSVSPGCSQVLARHQSRTGRREEADKNFLRWYQLFKDPIVREKQEYLYHFLVNRLEMINSLKSDKEYRYKLLNEGIALVIPSLYEYPLCDSLLGPLLNSMKGAIPFDRATLEQLKVFDGCQK